VPPPIKVVFSDSLVSADWGETTIATGDLPEAITRLKLEPSGGYLLAHGGARFARSLVETGLIDEYREPDRQSGSGRASSPFAQNQLICTRYATTYCRPRMPAVQKSFAAVQFGAT
jgi:hypothetical protein